MIVARTAERHGVIKGLIIEWGVDIRHVVHRRTFPFKVMESFRPSRREWIARVPQVCGDLVFGSFEE